MSDKATSAVNQQGTLNRVGFRDASDRSMGQLRLSLDQSQARADAVVGGLADAVRLAGGLTDRSRRITVLVDAIDGAIAGLRDVPAGGTPGN